MPAACDNNSTSHEQVRVRYEREWGGKAHEGETVGGKETWAVCMGVVSHSKRLLQPLLSVVAKAMSGLD